MLCGKFRKGNFTPSRKQGKTNEAWMVGRWVRLVCLNQNPNYIPKSTGQIPLITVTLALLQYTTSHICFQQLHRENHKWLNNNVSYVTVLPSKLLPYIITSLSISLSLSLCLTSKTDDTRSEQFIMMIITGRIFRPNFLHFLQDNTLVKQSKLTVIPPRVPARRIITTC